jgi:hypothetical protein
VAPVLVRALSIAQRPVKSAHHAKDVVHLVQRFERPRANQLPDEALGRVRDGRTLRGELAAEIGLRIPGDTGRRACRQGPLLQPLERLG